MFKNRDVSTGYVLIAYSVSNNMIISVGCPKPKVSL